MNPTAQLVETVRALGGALLGTGPACAAALFAVGGVVLAVLWWAARRRAERAEAAEKAPEPATRADLHGVELELARVRDALAEGGSAKVDDSRPAPTEPMLWHCPYCLECAGKTGTALDRMYQTGHLATCKASPLVAALQGHEQFIVLLKKRLREVEAASLSRSYPQRCMHCEETVDAMTGRPVEDVAREHDARCPHNPLVSRLAEVTGQRSQCGDQIQVYAKELSNLAARYEEHSRCPYCGVFFR